MKTLAVLSRLAQTTFSLKKSTVPVSVEAKPVKKQMQFLTEMTFIYILKLLGVEDEEKLAQIVSRLREGTPFYNFTFLAHNLAKSKTDFDFLTSPENLAAYAKIAEVSRECGIVLLPYVNVLSRIAENKQYGLYSENQEVGFFLDEYHRYKDSVGASEFLQQFKKILKYKTQRLFERFIKDGIFSLIQRTLANYSTKISTAQVLAMYVYGLCYYKCDISNADENFLIEHIRFCVDYLSSHGEIAFKPIVAQKIFPTFESEEKALNYFFSHNSETLDSLERFCALLKDVCPTEEAVEFCEFLRENLNKTGDIILDDKKNNFTWFLAMTIREKSRTEGVQLYTDMLRLFPQRFICKRSPHLLHHGREPYFHFFDCQGNFLFYAAEHGNKNAKIPEAHVFVELEILKKGEDGSVEAWDWHSITNAPC